MSALYLLGALSNWRRRHEIQTRKERFTDWALDCRISLNSATLCLQQQFNPDMSKAVSLPLRRQCLQPMTIVDLKAKRFHQLRMNILGQQPNDNGNQLYVDINMQCVKFKWQDYFLTSMK